MGGRSSMVKRIGIVVRLLLAAYGLLLLCIFYSPLADYLVRPLYVPADLRPAPVIVVLTAHVSPNGVLNESALRRIHAAARLYHRNLSPLVIISGGDPASSNDRQPADFMAERQGKRLVGAHAIVIVTKRSSFPRSCLAENVICVCAARARSAAHKKCPATIPKVALPAISRCLHAGCARSAV